MDVITEIRRERGKFRIVVNAQEVLTVPLLLFRERPLQEGDTIDLAEYDNWLMLHQYRHALERAVEYLAARAHSRREIEQKLLRIGYRPCTVEMVLYKLEKEKLLDDADFAQQWAAARANRKLGRNRIAQELRQKGITGEDAEVALDTIDEEEQLSSAVALAQKALQRAKPGEDPRKTRQRVSAMLARRGYSWDTVREALSQAMDSADEEW